MRILLAGLGSIGERHLRNIRDLGYCDVSVVTRRINIPDEFNDFPVYHSIEEALSFADSFDAAIVCTVTAQHVADMEKLLKKGIKHIYVEKPASHNYAGISELLKLAYQKQARIVVGYDLHFDPGLQKIKSLMAKDAIGKPISIHAVVGQYLPDWRPQQDYTQGMSAKTQLGGGVMLDLIHEFDYIYRLFGPVKTLAAYTLHSESLNIETEDVAEVILKFENGALGAIHLDYLQPYIIRHCTITGSEGSIIWDIVQKQVRWNNRQKKAFCYEYQNFERNDRFKESISVFLQRKEDERLTTLEQGLASLRMVLAAKHSSAHQKFVDCSQLNLEQNKVGTCLF